MKLYIAVPVNDSDFDYSVIAQLSDGLILMNYDQHYPGGDPGAVSGQDWFVKNMQEALKVIPKAEDHLRGRELRLRLGDEEGPEERHAAGEYPQRVRAGGVAGGVGLRNRHQLR